MLTRDQVLDRALKLITEEGLRRFSVSELGLRLGVVKSALYHHFPGGKAEIVREVFGREENRVLEAMEEALNSAATTRDKLCALALAKIVLVRELGRLYRIREEIADELEGFLVSRRLDFLRRERNLIASVIQEGIEKQQLRPVNAHLLAVALQGALHNLSRTYAVEGQPLRSEEVESLIDCLLEGINA